MSKHFEYGAENRWHDQYFEKGVTLPDSAGVVCANALAVGQHHGALAVTLVADGAVSIPAAKKLIVSVQGSGTENGVFADVASAPEMSVSGGADAAAVFADGEVIGKLVLPDMADYARIKLTTDGAATGKVDVFLNYPAR